MAQKDMWKLAKEKIMEERGRLPNEEGGVVKEYKAMHEEDFFWSSGLREDKRDNEERKAKLIEKKKKRKNRGKGKRRKKRAKRRLEDVRILFLWKLFEIFNQGGDMESCGDVSWEDLLEEPKDLSDREPVSCDLVRVVPAVIDVLVFHSAVVTELCDASPCCSDWEFVEPQVFSFSRKRAHCCTKTKDEMRYEGLPMTAPPLSRRRMTSPTPVQNSHTSFVRDHGRYEEEGRGLNSRERTIIARTRQFLEEAAV